MRERVNLRKIARKGKTERKRGSKSEKEGRECARKRKSESVREHAEGSESKGKRASKRERVSKRELCVPSQKKDRCCTQIYIDILRHTQSRQKLCPHHQTRIAV